MLNFGVDKDPFLILSTYINNRSYDDIFLLLYITTLSMTILAFLITRKSK